MSFKVRVRGDRACFTRPEAKVERMSYEIMTPSAAKGILEAILWHPGMTWVVERIFVLKPIQFECIKRNEVKGTCNVRGSYKEFYADKQRTQRTTIFLTNVDYIVEAHFTVDTSKIPIKDGIKPLTEAENITKFTQMFYRRIEKNEHFQQPCLGLREFMATVEKAPDTWETPMEFTYKSLGWMLKDFNYAGDMKPIMFEAILHNGCMEIPA